MSFHYESDPAFALLPPKLKQEVKKGTFLGLPPMKTRITYQGGKIDSKEIEQICFVAFNPEDKGKKGYKDSLETESWYVTTHPPDNWKKYWDKKVIVRVNYKGNTDISHINFPVTDHWTDQEYRKLTDWVI
jgi:hypothetical protein